MGAGKTTVGRILTRDDPTRFLDLDEHIVHATGKDIRTLFTELGERGFREVEERLAFACMRDDRYDVIALGGGTVTSRTFRHAALREGVLVSLMAAENVLSKRVSGTGRPLLDREGALGRILEERRDAYAECHASVQTSDRSPADVASSVRAAASRSTMTMPLGTRSYGIEVASSSAESVARTVRELEPSQVLLVTDENVEHLQRPYLQALARALEMPTTEIVIPAGEAHKNLETVSRIWDAALGASSDRDAIILAVGGGVTLDLAGFAAATLLRGLRWVGVPSTLLAMVDASVGGKTGFDHGGGKNRIGAFHQPSAITIDLDLLATLPEREFRAGAAEVVKTALVTSEALSVRVGELAGAIVRRETNALSEVIAASMAEKIRIVADDETEHGNRIVLNLGHTLAHALEAAGGYETYLHGEAVGIGLVLEHAFGVRKGYTDAAVPGLVSAQLTALGLPTTAEPELLALARNFLQKDKKRKGV